MKETFNELKTNVDSIVTDRITQQLQLGQKAPVYEQDPDQPNAKVAPRNMRIKALDREVNPVRIWTSDQLNFWISKLVTLNSTEKFYKNPEYIEALKQVFS